MANIDQSTVKRWINLRDAGAFRDIVVCYSGMVYGTCRRITGDAVEAEDLTQQSFQALAQAKRPPTEYLGPWLHRVATNLALKHVRSERRRKIRERLYAEEAFAPPTTDLADIQHHVDQAITALPESLRVPVVAYFLDNDSQADIASRLGVSQQTVSYRIKQGVKSIGDSLRHHGVFVPTTALTTLLEGRLAAAASVPASLEQGLGRIAIAQSAKPVATGMPIAASRFVVALSAKSTLSMVAVAVAVAALLVWLRSDGPHSESLPTEETVQVAHRGSISVDAGAIVAHSAVSESLPNRASAPLENAESHVPLASASSMEQAEITGRIYDAGNGRGIEGAKLRAFSEFLASAETTSGTDGAYALAGLKRNDSWQIGIEAEGYGHLTSVPILVPERDALEHVDFALGSPATVEGIVVDTNGAPIGNVEVTLSWQPLRRSQPPQPSAKTNPAGWFRIENAGPGEYGFYVSLADGSTLMGLNDPVTVAFGERLTNVQIVVAPVDIGYPVGGLVTDESGDGIPDVSVQTINREVLGTTDARGHFQVMARDEGFGVQLEFLREGFTQFRSPSPILPGTMDVSVVMVRNGGLAGLVRNGETGEALQEFTVSIKTLMDGSAIRIAPYSNDFGSPDGAFLIPDLSPGVATIEASASDLAPQIMDEVIIQSGQTTEGLEFSLYPGGRIGGNVVNADNDDPIARAEVYMLRGTGGLRIPSRPETKHSVSNLDGSFVLEDLSPGSHALVVVHPDFAPAMRTVEVRSNMEERLSIEMVSGGSVEGRVFLNGHALGQCPVLLSGPFTGTSRHFMQTTEQGGFRFDKLLEGEYLINASANGWSSEVKVMVMDGFNTEQNFDFVIGSSVVEGSVTVADDAYGAATGLVKLFIEIPGGRQYLGCELVDGFYRIEGLPGGEHVLEVFIRNPTAPIPGSFCSVRDGDEVTFPSHTVHVEDGEIRLFNLEIGEEWLDFDSIR